MPETYLARGERVAIRLLERADRAAFTRATRENAAAHHPWLSMPTTDEAFDAYCERFTDPSRAGFVVCLPGTGELAGFCNINNIVLGSFLSGALGYGTFLPGRRLLTEGVALVVRHAFGPMGLHRLEINAQPANHASVALARRLGFRLEGLSPGMLFIDGAWRDHERWAITSEMLDAPAP